jgi:DNA-binding transcriptional LysR family regulator
MDVIGHEAIGEDRHGVRVVLGLQPFKINAAVLVGEEDGLPAIAALRDMMREAGKDGAGESGHRAEEDRPLRVTATNAFACRWLVPCLPEWRKASPGIAIEVIGTDSVLTLRDGEADLAIRYAYTAPSGGGVRELFRDLFSDWQPHVVVDARTH